MMKICVLIPSYNEGGTISDIVTAVKAMGLDVVVVDDGSTDNTGKKAAENGAIIMRHAENLGKGASLKEGFSFIIDKTSFDGVIVMDGDGQHDPKDISKFITHAQKYDDDMVIGNRMQSANGMPFIRLVTNKLMSSFLSGLCRQYIPDTQCGFRLIRCRVLKKINLESNNYDLESEMLIKASRERFKIASVPIQTIYNGQLSRIHPVKDTIRFIGLIIKSYFKR